MSEQKCPKCGSALYHSGDILIFECGSMLYEGRHSETATCTKLESEAQLLSLELHPREERIDVKGNLYSECAKKITELNAMSDKCPKCGAEALDPSKNSVILKDHRFFECGSSFSTWINCDEEIFGQTDRCKITTLESQKAKLVTALGSMVEKIDEEFLIESWDDDELIGIKLGDLRLAAATLEEVKEK